MGVTSSIFSKRKDSVKVRQRNSKLLDLGLSCYVCFFLLQLDEIAIFFDYHLCLSPNKSIDLTLYTLLFLEEGSRVKKKKKKKLDI